MALVFDIKRAVLTKPESGMAKYSFHARDEVVCSMLNT